MSRLRIFRPLLLAAAIASLSACGGGGDDSPPSEGGGSTQPTSGLASFAGQYDLKTEDGTVLSVTVDQNGRVISCGAAYTCEGTLALKPGGREASLRISGSDGQGPTGIRVSVDASIDSAGVVKGDWAAQSSEGSSNGSLTGQKKPGGSGGSTGGSGGSTSATVSSFAGKYNLRADEGTTMQFTAGSDGSIKSCVGEAIYACSGSLKLDSGSQGASFTISGNDGEKPVDTTVTLTGKIDLQGNVTGSYNLSSKSEGNFKGSFSGNREGGASTTAPGTAQGCGPLAGTWTNPRLGVWVFSGSKAELTLDSTDTPGAQQITELALSSCASGVLQYKIVRAAVRVGSTYLYDAGPGTPGVDWNKAYSQPYTLTGNRLTIANDVYTKQ